MNLQKLIKRLDSIATQIKKSGGDVEASEVAIEAIEDTGDTYYEQDFDLFVDSSNDIGLSPINK